MKTTIRLFALLLVSMLTFTAFAQPQPRAAGGRVSISDASATESDGSAVVEMTFTLTLSNPGPQEYAVIIVSPVNGTADGHYDYDFTRERLFLSAQEPVATFAVEVANDHFAEATETFKVFIYVETSIGGNTKIADGKGVGTIFDDDTAYSLLANGKFESNLSGWQVTPTAGSVKRICGGVGYKSNCAVSLKAKKPALDNPAITFTTSTFTGIPFTVGHPIRLEHWFKVPVNGALRMTLIVNYSDAAATVLVQNYGATGGGGVWVNHKLPVSLTSVSVTSVSLKYENLSALKGATVDSVKLVYSD